jgi:hypothetical protein
MNFDYFFMDSYGSPKICQGSGARMPDGLWRPVPPCDSGLDPLYTKILDSAGVDLEAGGLDA